MNFITRKLVKYAKPRILTSGTSHLTIVLILVVQTQGVPLTLEGRIIMRSDFIALLNNMTSMEYVNATISSNTG